MTDIIKFLPELSLDQLQDTQRTSIVAGNVTVAVLATVAISLRVAARWSKGFGPDDILAVAALPVVWGMAAAALVASDNGLGQHLWAVFHSDPAQLSREGQSYFAAQFLWAVATPIVKISILLLYVRALPRAEYLRRWAWGLGAAALLWMVIVVIVGCLQCQPIAFIWDKTIAGKCINAYAFFVIANSVNMVLNLIILVLPLPALFAVRLSSFQCFTLVGIFLVGALACAASIFHLAIVVQTNQSTDTTWALGNITISSAAEPSLGIIAASLPTFAAFFESCVPSLASSRSDDLELGKPCRKSWGFRELNDDARSMGTISRTDSREGHRVKEGVIEVQTTFETRHSYSQ